METVIITWGAWYVWSHVAQKFLEEGYEVAIVDNLSNSNDDIVTKLHKSTGQFPDFYQVDIKDTVSLERVFNLYENIVGVVHMASQKWAIKSKEKMFFYYDNNIFTNFGLFKLMEKYNIENLVNASSSDVYAHRNSQPPYSENSRFGEYTPYWATKLIMEIILRELSERKWFNIYSLRLFEVVWASSCGNIWEDLTVMDKTMLGEILGSLCGMNDDLTIYWKNLNTYDWSRVFDFVHVEDVAKAFYLSFENLRKKEVGFDAINIWTWKWTSFNDMLDIAKNITWENISINYEDSDPSLPQSSFADVSKAYNQLWWSAQKSLSEGVESAWSYTKKMYLD